MSDPQKKPRLVDEGNYLSIPVYKLTIQAEEIRPQFPIPIAEITVRRRDGQSGRVFFKLEQLSTGFYGVSHAVHFDGKFDKVSKSKIPLCWRFEVGVDQCPVGNERRQDEEGN